MNNTEAWIRLTLTPGLGSRSIKQMLDHYQDADAILGADLAAIKRLDLLKKQQLDALARPASDENFTRTMQTLEKCRARAICWDDEEYPEALRQLPDPPFVLYLKGTLQEIDPAVAVVGTRAPSHYGRELAGSLAADLSRQGLSIISGLARGIDTAAHTGSLDGCGRAVAVLGSGIDTIYPAENVPLAQKISARGAVISEYPPGTRPDPGNFPRRNRIIAGLSLGVIVIEATIKSGAMITARLAGEQGRSVMATPGPVTNLRARGPHSLLKQGAALIENAEDVLRELAPHLMDSLAKTGASQETASKDIFGGNALTLEEIAAELGMDVPTAAKHVSMMEIKGKIAKAEGGRYIFKE